MEVNFSGDIPIYRQIATQIEESILTGAFPEEEQIPSTTEISQTYRINPATVLKGMNLLVAEDIIYKKRGLGMFVKTGAVKKLKKNRQASFYSHYVAALINEARRLAITEEELIELIKGGYQNEKN